MLVLLLALLASAAEPPKAEGGGLLSPSGRRVARAEGASIVILDAEGRVRSKVRPKFSGAGPEGECANLWLAEWVGEEIITAECHLNPSLNAYVAVDIATGRTVRDLLGYDFTRSPDGKRVAHAGWLPHFAPPFAKSAYLEIDHTVIYPLPPGKPPVERRGLESQPYQVRANGNTFTGIHEFQSPPLWSPDSRRIALIDCTYDWTVSDTNTGAGVESNRRCEAVIVTLEGAVTRKPVASILGGFKAIFQ